VTKLEIKKGKWWWASGFKSALQRPTFRRFFDSSTYRKGLLRAAWFYEVEERLAGGYRFGKPFHRLSSNEIMRVIRLWGHSQQDIRKGSPQVAPAIFLITEKPPQESETFNLGNWWRPNIVFNLAVANQEILRELAAFLDSARSNRRLGPPKKGRPANSNYDSVVGEPWKKLEIMDRAACGVTLSPDERSAKAKAEKEYYDNIPCNDEIGWNLRLQKKRSKAGKIPLKCQR
jgi:hypothetical protein